MNLPTDQLSRRRFCQTSGSALGIAAAAGLTQVLSSRSASGMEARGSIDAHVHVWTPDVRRYPLDDQFTPSDMRPASFTPQQLFQHTKPAGVDRIVLIQMSFYNYDNSYMLDMIAEHPGVFSGVGIVDHDAANVAEQIRTLSKSGVRGIRLHARGGESKQWVSSEGMKRLWEAATGEGMAVCPLINPDDLAHVETLSRRHAETTVVIDHFARVGISGQIVPDQLDHLCRLASLPNVHVKTSAFYALGKKTPPYKDLMPMIRKVVDAFGPDRLMWASDCPYQVQRNHTYEDSIALIRDAATSELSDREKHGLLRGTAEKVFF